MTPADRSSIVASPDARRPVVEAAPARPRRRSLDQLNDREAGIVAAWVIGALGATIALILVLILVYAASWGYFLEITL